MRYAGRQGQHAGGGGHDGDTIRRADHIIDIGPGAGKRGGRLVPKATRRRWLRTRVRSPAASWPPMRHPLNRAARWRPATTRLLVRGASLHNLKRST